MEGVPRMPMLEVELKHNSLDYSSLDWAGMPSEDVHEVMQQQITDALKKHIREEYSDNPDKFNDSIEKLIEIQTASYKAILSPDFEGCNLLKKYYGQLHYMQSRFPFSGDDGLKVTFTWQDAFTGILTVHESFAFEQTAILFNIGAIHSLLGAADNRTTEEGIRISCVHFQCAAGLFTYIAEHFDTTLSPDIGQGILKLFINIMLAQGQECLLEKSMQDNRKHSIVSKICQQVVDYYKHCLVFIENRESENILGSTAYKSWKKMINFKILYYSAITKYFTGNNVHEQDKYGQAVAYFGASVHLFNDSVKLAKSFQKDIRLKVDEALKFTSDVLNGKYNSSVKDNNFVYHDKVPDVSTLPEVKGASLVKALPFEPANESLTGPDIFAKLVPMEAHLAASTYSEEKAKLLRSVVEQIEQKDEVLSQYKQSIELDPKKLIDPDEPRKLDQALIEKCALFNVDQSPITELKQALEDLTEVFNDLDSVLNNILTIVENEESEDQKLQETAGKEAFSTQEDIEGLKKELESYKQLHHEASRMNEDLHTACRIHIQNMKLVAGGIDTLREELNIIKISDLITEDDRNVIGLIRKLCEKVIEMEDQRKSLLEQLRQQMESDDVTSTLVTKHGVDQEDLFKEELKKYDSLIDTINKNLSAQDNIFTAVTEANARYTKIRKIVETERERVDLRVTNLVLSCDVFDDVFGKCKEGKNFFGIVCDKAKELYGRAKEFHDESEAERRKIYKKIEEKKKPPPRPSAPKPKLDKKPQSGTPTPTPGMTLSPDILSKMMAEDEDELLNDPEFLHFLQTQGDLHSMELPSSYAVSAQANYPATSAPASRHHIPSRPHTMSPSLYRPSVQSPTYPAVSSPVGVPGHHTYHHANPRPPPQLTPPRIMSPGAQQIFLPSGTAQSFGLARQFSGGSNVSDPRQSPGPGMHQADNLYQTRPHQPGPSPLPVGHYHPAHPGPIPHQARVGESPMPQHVAMPQSMTPLPQSTSPILQHGGMMPQNHAAVPQMVHLSSPMARGSTGVPQVMQSNPAPTMQQNMAPIPLHVATMPQSVASTMNTPPQVIHHNYYPQPQNQPQQGQPPPIQVSQVAIVYSTPPPCQSVADSYTQPNTLPAEYLTQSTMTAQYSQSDSALQLARQSPRPNYGPTTAMSLPNQQHLPQHQYNPGQGQFQPAGPMPTSTYAPQLSQPTQQGHPQAVHPTPPVSITPYQQQYHNNVTQQVPIPQNSSQLIPNHGQMHPAVPSGYMQPNITPQQFIQQPMLQRFSSAPPVQPVTQQPTTVSQQAMIRPGGPEQQGQGMNQLPYMPHQGMTPQYQTPTGPNLQQQPSRMPHPPNQQVSSSLAPPQNSQGFNNAPRQQTYQPSQPPHQLTPNQVNPSSGSQQCNQGPSQFQNMMPQHQGAMPPTSLQGPVPRNQGTMPPHQSLQGPMPQQQQIVPQNQGMVPPTSLQGHVSQQQGIMPQNQGTMYAASLQDPVPQQQGTPPQNQGMMAPTSLQGTVQQHQGIMPPTSLPGPVPQQHGTIQPTSMYQQGGPQIHPIQQVPQHQTSMQGQLPQMSSSMPQLAGPMPQVSTSVPQQQRPGPQPTSDPPQSQIENNIRQTPNQMPQNMPQQAATPPILDQPSQGMQPPVQGPGPQSQMAPTTQSVSSTNSTESYTFKSHPHPGQYLSTPSNENSPKHAPAQRSRQSSIEAPIKPMTVLTPTPVNVPQPPKPAPKQPSSDLAGLILTPSRTQSSSADELLFTSQEQVSNSTKGNSQVVLVPTKVGDDNDKMVVRPVEGLPYMDEADLMKFKGQVTKLRTKVSNLLHKPESKGLCELDKEWKQLSEEQEKYSRQLSTAIARCSSYKNRFQDIVPFDQSRVVLKGAKDDYINASVIDGVSPFCPRFIATQSPVPNTVSDFWLMVYEQQVNLIVMLVNSKDVPRKCPMYWPGERTVPQQHGSLTVSFTTSKTHGDLYIERTFTVKHKNQSLAMSVTQLQYIAWPEHRLPSSASDLLSFVAVVQSYHSSQRNLQWPVLVHCESGVGRTGAFCAFVTGINEINAGMCIMNVVDIVTKMRHKRKYMVQEKAQLKFVYDVILYHAVDILKQRNVTLEEEIKPAPLQVNPHPINPSQMSREFDIFSDSSALSSIQATVEKMTIKSGAENMMQKNAFSSTKFESKTCSDIPDSSSNSMLNNNTFRPSTSELYSMFPTSTLQLIPNENPQINTPKIGGLSDLIQGTMNPPNQSASPPILHDIPPQNATKPDVVESCNSQVGIEIQDPHPAPSDPIQPRQVSSSPATLIESLTPESFTLNTDDEEAKRKQRITKEDFYKQRPGLSTEKDPSDPFSGLDPLWGLRK